MDILITVLALAVSHVLWGIGSLFDATLLTVFVLPALLYRRTKGSRRVICATVIAYVLLSVACELWLDKTEWLELITYEDKLLLKSEYLSYYVMPLLRTITLMLVMWVYFFGSTILRFGRSAQLLKSADLKFMETPKYKNEVTLLQNYAFMSAVSCVATTILIWNNIVVGQDARNTITPYVVTVLICVIGYLLIGKTIRGEETRIYDKLVKEQENGVCCETN